MAETHALSSKILLFSRDDLYSTDSSREKKKRWISKPCRVTRFTPWRVKFYCHNLIKGQAEFLTPQFGLITNVNRLSLPLSFSLNAFTLSHVACASTMMTPVAAAALFDYSRWRVMLSPQWTTTGMMGKEHRTLLFILFVR